MKQNLIETPIGNEQWSNTKDIKRIREALYRLGYEDQNLEYGYIDKTLDNNIRNFQKQNALKVDGLIFPGGETERLLISSLKNKISDEKKG